MFYTNETKLCWFPRASEAAKTNLDQENCMMESFNIMIIHHWGRLYYPLFIFITVGDSIIHHCGRLYIGLQSDQSRESASGNLNIGRKFEQQLRKCRKRKTFSESREKRERALFPPNHFPGNQTEFCICTEVMLSTNCSNNKKLCQIIAADKTESKHYYLPTFKSSWKPNQARVFYVCKTSK